MDKTLFVPEGSTVSVVQRLSATTFYPSWGTTMDKTLFVRCQRLREVRSI
jgi:hypothetical protein